MLKRWRFENCLIVALIVLQSCYAGYPPLPPVLNVSIDSIASPLADSKRTYLLFPGNLDTSSNDLLFQEYSNYLEPVLASLNYTPAQSETEVDLAIFLSYGIGDPQLREYTYSRPSWGQTGVSSINTITNSTRIGNSTTSSSTSIITPSFGVTGYSTYTETEMVYLRHLVIDAYDYKLFNNDGRLAEMWRTKITSSGTSNDLRRFFPVILAAGAPYIGFNTKNIITVTIFENADLVRIIKGNVFDFEPPVEEMINTRTSYMREINGIE